MTDRFAMVARAAVMLSLLSAPVPLIAAQHATSDPARFAVTAFSLSVSAPPPRQVTEISGHASGIMVIRELPSGETCLEEAPPTTYTIRSEARGSGWSQAIEIGGVADCGTEDAPLERLDYADQALVYLDDFNFDGETDLALNNGNMGAYGSMSYEVFLFDPAAQRYVKDEAFTDLAHYLGMFEVHPGEQMLYVNSKSGAAWHQRAGYRVIDNVPVRVYEQTVEYSSETDRTVTTRKLVDGVWTTTTMAETGGG